MIPNQVDCGSLCSHNRQRLREAGSHELPNGGWLMCTPGDASSSQESSHNSRSGAVSSISHCEEGASSGQQIQSLPFCHSHGRCSVAHHTSIFTTEKRRQSQEIYNMCTMYLWSLAVWKAGERPGNEAVTYSCIPSSCTCTEMNQSADYFAALSTVRCWV